MVVRRKRRHRSQSLFFLCFAGCFSTRSATNQSQERGRARVAGGPRGIGVRKQYRLREKKRWKVREKKERVIFSLVAPSLDLDLDLAAISKSSFRCCCVFVDNFVFGSSVRRYRQRKLYAEVLLLRVLLKKERERILSLAGSSLNWGGGKNF